VLLLVDCSQLLSALPSPLSYDPCPLYTIAYSIQYPRRMFCSSPLPLPLSFCLPPHTLSLPQINTIALSFQLELEHRIPFFFFFFYPRFSYPLSLFKPRFWFPVNIRRSLVLSFSFLSFAIFLFYLWLCGRFCV
jgi:hypothetical protein